MLELACDTRLFEEPLLAVGVRLSTKHHLDGEGSLKVRVDGAQDNAHPAAGDLSRDLIPSGQSPCDFRRCVRGAIGAAWDRGHKLWPRFV